MTVNRDLQDALIRHAIYSERFGKGLGKRIVAILDSADEELVEKIAARLTRIVGEDPGPRTTQRLTELLESIRGVNEKVYKRVAQGLSVELGDLAEYEGEFAADTLNQNIPVSFTATVPSPTYLRTLVETSPIDGFLLKSWTDNMSANRLGRVEKTLRLGLVQGETIDQLVRRIRGTKVNGFKDGVLNVSRNSARTLAITANSTIANQARLAVYRENPSVIRGLQWLSTLDSRTSPVCQSRDGQFYELDKPHPTPPAHPRCRSILIPVTKPFRELGVDRDDTPVGTRASMDGQVAGKTTYGEWLKRQPNEVQNDVLGVERARLFREGMVPFKDLYREDGQFYSLDQLRARSGVKAPAPKPTPVKPTPAPKTPAHAIDTTAIDTRERDYVLSQGKKTRVEHLVAYEATTGEIVERRQGKRSSVAFTSDLVRMIDNPANSIVLHHNHPSSSSLSLPDIRIVTERPGAAAIWAHGHNGSSYYAERGEFKLKTTTVNAITDSLRKSLQGEVNAGKLDVNDASLMHSHLVWLAVHNTGQLVYRAELAGKSATAFKRNEPFFNELLERLKS